MHLLTEPLSFAELISGPLQLIESLPEEPLPLQEFEPLSLLELLLFSKSGLLQVYFILCCNKYVLYNLE